MVPAASASNPSPECSRNCAPVQTRPASPRLTVTPSISKGARFSKCRSVVPALKMRFSRMLGREIIRSEEHTSELQSLMRISYAVFCLKKKKKKKYNIYNEYKQCVNS